MDVRIEGHRRGIALAVPRPGNGQQSVARGESEARGGTHPPVTSPSGAPAIGKVSGDTPTPAFFDANRDGVIESWSIAHGGDSFADFTPPPSGSAGSNVRRPNESTPGVADWSPGPDQPKTRANTAAAVHHAQDAYRRDGLSHAPGTRTGGGAAAPKTVSQPVAAGQRSPT